MKNGGRRANRLNEFKIELVCNICGDKFIAYKHERRKYCSRKCADVGRQHREIRTCAFCGEAFERPLYLLNPKPGIYCSILCSNRAKDRKWFKTMVRTSEHCAKIAQSRTGDKNPMWKGGVTPEHRIARNSAEYRKWRITVFKTDRFKCSYCGSNKRIEAHHIDPFSTNKEARYDPENGRTLCYECHKYVQSFGPTPAEQYMAYGVV